MGQPTPSSSHTPASSSVDTLAAAPAGVHRSGLPRLLLASALGLVAPLFCSPMGLDPWWGEPVGALVVLLVAVLLSGMLSSKERSHERREDRSVALRLASPTVAGILLSGLGLGFLVLRQLAAAAAPTQDASRAAALQWALLAAAVVPVLVGTASALVVQGRANAPLALGGAALSWLVACIANVV